MSSILWESSFRSEEINRGWYVDYGLADGCEPNCHGYKSMGSWQGTWINYSCLAEAGIEDSDKQLHPSVPVAYTDLFLPLIPASGTHVLKCDWNEILHDLNLSCEIYFNKNVYAAFYHFIKHFL